ncbi:MAG TPA: GerMN domain-containing protein [Syntrophorhabdaceae bacterium]|nr:GerMN domain-containing protein [Syntrophorhabdaceae bacterium]HPU31015.1 GerMN domain-containing protein [Syntrophorhabdaceae bacterium]
MLIEELEEEIKKKKQKKRIIFLLIAIILVGFAIFIRHNQFFNNNVIVQNKDVEAKEELVIFHPDEGLKLAKTTLKLQKGIQEKNRIDLALKTLKELKAIPEGLTLYEFALDERSIIYANFSKHLVEETKEPEKEITVIFSLVNTFLANIPDAKAVQLLIEGQPVYTLNGIIYTYNPIFYNENLLED